MDLRNQVYSRLIQQPMGFFQNNPVGRVMSAVINDIEQMRSAFSEYLADFFRQVFTFVALVSVLVYLNWKLAIGSVFFVPLVIYPIGKLGKKIRRSTERSRARLADLSQILQETISGNRVVKAFGMEGFEIKKFREAARNLRRENMRWVRAYAATSPLMDILSAVVFSLLLLYARDSIKHGIMDLGEFVAFMYALLRAYEPVKRLGGIYQLFQQALGTATQVFAFLVLNEEISEAPGAAVLHKFSREVELDNVSFAYDAGSPILRGVSVSVPAGAVVAIVGSSGAGKTTLVNLLPRFHSAVSGSVRIDGQDVRDVTLRSLREQMAIVTQETILFNDTVWNNLLRPPGLARGPRRGRFQSRAGPRFHHPAAQGLSDTDRRPRPAPLRRPAPAPGHRPRLAQRCSDSDSRRGHLRARLRIRNAGAKGPEQPHGRPNRLRYRSPALYHPPRRFDSGAGRRHNSRAGYAHRAAISRWNLFSTLRHAISR